MNQEIKRKWVAALRSQKYRQARHVLRIEDAKSHECRHCALGVLVELAVQDGIAEWTQDDSWGDSDERHYSVKANDGSRAESVLPNGVVLWAGLRNANPSLPDRQQMYGPRADNTYWASVTALNDEGKLTFAEFADLIEANL